MVIGQQHFCCYFYALLGVTVICSVELGHRSSLISAFAIMIQRISRKEEQSLKLKVHALACSRAFDPFRFCSSADWEKWIICWWSYFQINKLFPMSPWSDLLRIYVLFLLLGCTWVIPVSILGCSALQPHNIWIRNATQMAIWTDFLIFTSSVSV